MRNTDYEVPLLIRITTVPQSLHGLLNGQLKFISDNGYSVIGVSSPGEYLDNVAIRENIATVAIKMTRTISPIKDLISLYRLYCLLRKYKPAIVHTHTPKAGTLGMLASKMAGIPIRLHTVAGLPLIEYHGAKRVLLEIVERVTYACASRIYPNSFVQKEFILKNRFCSPQKLKVIANGSSNGIDTSYFNPELFNEDSKIKLKNDLHIPESAFIFIFIGRLVKDKGINELVAAFSELNNLNGILLLVGNYEEELDPLLSETMDLIKNNSKIISTGYQKDVRPFLAISDALVFPSYREGFPNVVMQAGAMGLPAIVTDINGCNEIILDGVNGMIIPPKDEPALFCAMASLMANRQKARKLSVNAREMITSRYEQKIVWDALLEEYNELINELNISH